VHDWQGRVRFEAEDWAGGVLDYVSRFAKDPGAADEEEDSEETDSDEDDDTHDYSAGEDEAGDMEL